MVAITDGVAHRVRRDIMDELLEATVYELSLSSAVLGANVSKAAVVIQSAVRRRAAFRETRSLVTRIFTKMYDPQYWSFYWYNQGTGQSAWEKPTVIEAFLKRKLA